MVMSMLMVMMVTVTVMVTAQSDGLSVTVSFDQVALTKIKEEEIRNVTVNFTNLDSNGIFFEVTSLHPTVAQVMAYNYMVDSSPIYLQVKGIMLGRTNLTWKVTQNLTGGSINQFVGEVPVSVLQQQASLQLYFTLVIVVLVSFNNVSMGCMINMETIKEVLSKPVAPAIGFVSQFLFMPLGSYIIGYLAFPENISWRLGLFVLGCCPGGTGSNFWTLLFDGDVDLSITMTFISSIAAMAMMPLWIFTLGRSLLQEANAKIPYVNLITSLVVLTITLGIGLAIQKWRPSLAKRLKKLLKTYTTCLLIFIICGAIYVNLYMLKHMTWRIVGAGLGCALSGYFFGGLTAALFGLNYRQVIAVSIETALQNPGVAFVLLQLSLDQPDADLSAIPVVGQLFMTGIPLWITFGVYSFFKKCCGCCPSGDGNDDGDEEKGNEKKKKEKGIPKMTVTENKLSQVTQWNSKP